MAGLSIVRWFEWVVGGTGLVLALMLAGRIIRFIGRRDASPLSQTIDTSEPASNVQVRTDVNGWASVTVGPTINRPARRGTALVMFVRARAEGQSRLAGSSTRAYAGSPNAAVSSA